MYNETTYEELKKSELAKFRNVIVFFHNEKYQFLEDGTVQHIKQ